MLVDGSETTFHDLIVIETPSDCVEDSVMLMDGLEPLTGLPCAQLDTAQPCDIATLDIDIDGSYSCTELAETSTLDTAVSCLGADGLNDTLGSTTNILEPTRTHTDNSKPGHHPDDHSCDIDLTIDDSSSSKPEHRPHDRSVDVDLTIDDDDDDDDSDVTLVATTKP